MYNVDSCTKHANSELNKFHTKFKADGTFTVHFGSKEVCGDVPKGLEVIDANS